MESCSRIALERSSIRSFNSLTGNGRPLKRMQSTEGLQSEADGNHEYPMPQHLLTWSSVETIPTSVRDTREFNGESAPCKGSNTLHQCFSLCTADYRSKAFSGGEGKNRFQRPVTALPSEPPQISVRPSYKRKVLREIWLPLILVFVPMLIIPTLFAVLVIKYRVHSERSLFSEVQGARYMQQRTYVLLKIPASESPYKIAQDQY